jgi:hypothetical protein
MIEEWNTEICSGKIEEETQDTISWEVLLPLRTHLVVKEILIRKVSCP